MRRRLLPENFLGVFFFDLVDVGQIFLADVDHGQQRLGRQELVTGQGFLFLIRKVDLAQGNVFLQFAFHSD